MYYSKNGFGTISIPKNYSGNTFKVIDETPKRQENDFLDAEKSITQASSTKIEEVDDQNHHPNSIFNSFFSEISVEDLLLLGIIFVIHQENPNDSTLLLLLILLLAK